MNVMVSMASKGAILVDEEDNIHVCESPAGTVVSSVNDILKYAVYAGSATAYSEGLATITMIDELCKR